MLIGGRGITSLGGRIQGCGCINLEGCASREVWTHGLRVGKDYSQGLVTESALRDETRFEIQILDAHLVDDGAWDDGAMTHADPIDLFGTNDLKSFDRVYICYLR